MTSWKLSSSGAQLRKAWLDLRLESSPTLSNRLPSRFRYPWKESHVACHCCRFATPKKITRDRRHLFIYFTPRIIEIDHSILPLYRESRLIFPSRIFFFFDTFSFVLYREVDRSRCWYVLDGVYHRVFYKKTLVTRDRRDFGRDFHTAVNTLLRGMDSLFPSEEPREIESNTGFHSCLSISSIFCHAGCAT